nr:hypothetical protein [Anaerolineaceae bacterium]
TPEPTTTTPEPTTQTPEPTTTTPEPTTQTPEPTTTTPEPTTQTPEPTTATPEPTTQTPESTTTTPEPTTETTIPTDIPTDTPPPGIPVTGGDPVVLPAFAFVIPVTGGQPIITAGLGHTCMTVADEVYCWGLNISGQVGNGNNENQLQPVKVLHVRNVVDLTSGSEFSCALTADGNIWCWGKNDSGQLGDGTTHNRSTPVLVKGLPAFATGFTAGEAFTCAELENNETWCWGNNEFGQINDGSKTNRDLPVKTLFDQNQNLISGGNNYLLGENSGDLAAWMTGNSQIVSDMFFPQAISANRFLSGGCAVTFAGTVNCWGNDFNLVDIQNISTAVEVGTGLEYGCSVNEDLTVSCWGANYFGQLGNGTNDDSVPATNVNNITDVRALAVGALHTCVLVGDDFNAYCWGANPFGQLGNNSTDNNPEPVFVSLSNR